jgi:hypothetical protein
VVVLAANAAYLSGAFDPNPINLYAGLSDLTRTGILAGLPSADPNTGITAQALGHLAALDWLHGHVPWWNPYEGLGAPLAGEMQSAAFFPPTVFLLLANGQVFFHLVLELTAGLTTYALLVRLRLARVAAVPAAAAARCGVGHRPARQGATVGLGLRRVRGGLVRLRRVPGNGVRRGCVRRGMGDRPRL